MNFTTYLNFDGTCAEAFRFYARTFGGTIEFSQTMGESPFAEQTPPEHRGRIMHIRLRAGDGILLGSDSPPGMPEKPSGFAITFALDDRHQAEQIFNALADGGQVEMPLAESYWADRFGMLKDRYGVRWMINSGMKELPAS